MATPDETNEARADQLVELIDAAAPGRLVISGSPPGSGGDLDLLLRPEQREAVGDALDRAGFLSRGRMWARFDGEDVEAVELFTTDDFRLPADEVDALLEAATPLHPGGKVSLPGPAETVLLLAIRYGEEPDELQPRHRARIRAALDRDPLAWEEAEWRAASWHVDRALAALRAAYDEPAASAPPSTRRERRHERRRGRRRRGGIVAVAGLDGSGKSTQANLLRDNLDRLGYDATIVWSRLEWDTLVEGRALSAIALPVKVALRAAGYIKRDERREATLTGADASPARGAVTPYRRPVDAASALRRRSTHLTGAWVTIVALVHALSTRRKLAPYLRSGAVVVCDRYVLDTMVFLRFIYGEERAFRLARRVLTLVSPTPVVTWFLDVDSSTALGRKPDEFDSAELDRLRVLYRETANDLGATRLDGSRPKDDLAPVIGLHTWWSLP